jgi:hypothetical protein
MRCSIVVVIVGRRRLLSHHAPDLLLQELVQHVARRRGRAGDCGRCCRRHAVGRAVPARGRGALRPSRCVTGGMIRWAMARSTVGRGAIRRMWGSGRGGLRRLRTVKTDRGYFHEHLLREGRPTNDRARAQTKLARRGTIDPDGAERLGHWPKTRARAGASRSFVFASRIS